MTREERYKHYCLPEHVSQMDKIEKIIWEVIEDCHDDFNSRTCENCKHWFLVGMGDIKCNNYKTSCVHTKKDFGCNKFESKDK